MRGTFDIKRIVHFYIKTFVHFNIDIFNLYTSWRKPVYFIGEILYTLLYRLHLESLRDKLIILQYQLNFNEERSLAHKQENSVIDDLLGK